MSTLAERAARDRHAAAEAAQAVTLDLDPEEAAEMRRSSTQVLGDLSQEIACTDNAGYRRRLRERRERLRAIERKLGVDD